VKVDDRLLLGGEIHRFFHVAFAAKHCKKHIEGREWKILDFSKSSTRITSLIGNEACCSSVLLTTRKKERDMDREHVRGAADKAKGAIKETAGKVSGDKELESEGKMDKAKGDIHNAAGNIKDAARKLSK
jgi:uncharacterized protein YjbJ (UPF0337 family)